MRGILHRMGSSLPGPAPPSSSGTALDAEARLSRPEGGGLASVGDAVACTSFASEPIAVPIAVVEACAGPPRIHDGPPGNLGQDGHHSASGSLCRVWGGMRIWLISKRLVRCMIAVRQYLSVSSTHVVGCWTSCHRVGRCQLARARPVTGASATQLADNTSAHQINLGGVVWRLKMLLKVKGSLCTIRVAESDICGPARAAGQDERRVVVGREG